jgi:hypothetical protein
MTEQRPHYDICRVGKLQNLRTGLSMEGGFPDCRTTPESGSYEEERGDRKIRTHADE